MDSGDYNASSQNGPTSQEVGGLKCFRYGSRGSGCGPTSQEVGGLK